MKGFSIALVLVFLVVGILGGCVWYVMHMHNAKESVVTTPVNSVPQTSSSSFASGTLEMLTDNGFTVLLHDNTTREVSITGTTTIQKSSSTGAATAISFNQLSIGDQVVVMGAMREDGSIVAERISTGVQANTKPEGYPNSVRATN